jgi:predicted transposase YbfD/YdcC
MARRPTLVELFSTVPDPRVNRTKLHELSDILALVLCGVLSDADSFTEIETFGKSKEAWLRSFLALPNGIPSHDTLGRVFSRLDPEAVRSCFRRWVKALQADIRENYPEGVIAVDGKTLRRSFDRAAGVDAIHMVSAWSSACRLVVGQVKTSTKSNEITAIPALLDLLDVAGCVVTTDAMGCQKKIVTAITDKGADYLLAVKSNQPTLHDDVVAYFADAKARGFENRPVSRFESRDYEHGRMEIRRYTVSSEVQWLQGQDSDGNWAGLSSIAMVETERTVGNRTSRQTRYYITSLPAEAKRIGKAIRAHWSIENQLHWSLDVSFDEDQCRVRKDNAAENLAIVRHMALNLLKQEGSCKLGIKAKRHKAAWDNEYLLKVLAG